VEGQRACDLVPPQRLPPPDGQPGSESAACGLEGGEISLLEPPALINRGEIVFTAAFADAPAWSGLLRAAGGQLSKVVEEGDITPGGEPFSLASAFFSLTLTDAGEVALSTEQGDLGYCQSGEPHAAGGG
jgi:hypothetical protein